MPPHSSISTQRLVLSARFLLGEAGNSRNDRLEALARFAAPDAISSFFDEAGKAGFGALLTPGDERIVAALKQTRSGPNDAKGARLQILPVIPNVPGYVREATEHGLAGAGLRRLLRAGPMGFLRASAAGALHVRKVLRKDFATLLSILYELEMGELRRFSPPSVFLHHQMTDLALGFSNRAFFEQFAVLMRERFQTEPGLSTSNFVLLAQKIIEWDLPISLILAPFNRENFLMPGGRDAYRRMLDTGRFHLVADRLSPEFPTPLDAIEWALHQAGVVSVIADWAAA